MKPAPMKLHEHCMFKTTRVRDRAPLLHEAAIEIMYDMSTWAEKHGLPFVVTETVSTLNEDQALKRVSATHREARAFDVSVKGWSDDESAIFVAEFNACYAHKAAVSPSSGKPQLVVRHSNGHGDHFHVQLSRVFAIYSPVA